MTLDVKENFASAAVVVVGTIETVDEPAMDPYARESVRSFTVGVEEVWKGNPGKQVTLRAGTSSCGLMPEIGKRYVFGGAPPKTHGHPGNGFYYVWKLTAVPADKNAATNLTALRKTLGL